jgi:hypothetical protein
VIYDDCFETIRQEIISMHFNDSFCDKGFRDAILSTAKAACEALHGTECVKPNGTQITVSNVTHQTPRLLLAPLLGHIVREQLRFFYAKSIGEYVSCGFYTSEQGDYATPCTELIPTTGICFDDVKRLLEGRSSTSFMSLPEYWKVYRECEAVGDRVTLQSLRDPNYVELLDTIIRAGTEVTHHDRRPTGPPPRILEARPALIRPANINPQTGFPDRLVSADTYGDNTLWRYWSPDGRERGHARAHLRHEPDKHRPQDCGT